MSSSLPNKRVESLPTVARAALRGPNFATAKSVPYQAAAHAKRYTHLTSEYLYRESSE